MLVGPPDDYSTSADFCHELPQALSDDGVAGLRARTRWMYGRPGRSDIIESRTEHSRPRAGDLCSVAARQGYTGKR